MSDTLSPELEGQIRVRRSKGGFTATFIYSRRWAIPSHWAVVGPTEEAARAGIRMRIMQHIDEHFRGGDHEEDE